MIDRRVTKREQNLHLCALLYSEQRTKQKKKINKSSPCSQFWSWEWKHCGQKWPPEKPKVSGNPLVVKAGWGVGGVWGWGGERVGGGGMICVGLGFAKVTPGRPETIKASSFVPSVSPPACCHTCRCLSLSLNGFPRFLMTAQPLFMSWGPITKTVNAGSKAQFTLH